MRRGSAGRPDYNFFFFIFAGKSTTNISKSVATVVLKDWIGDGLLISTGAKHASRRKLISPSFHFEALRAYAIVMNEQGDRWIGLLGQRAAQDAPFDIYPYIIRMSLDVFAETALGVVLNGLRPFLQFFRCLLTHVPFASPRGRGVRVRRARQPRAPAGRDAHHEPHPPLAAPLPVHQGGP